MSVELKRLLKFSFGSWVTFLFAFIASPVTTFLLAPQEFGKFASFILFQTLAVYVISLGMDQVFLRFYHQAESKIHLLVRCLIAEAASFLVLLFILLLFNRQLNHFVAGLNMPDRALAVEGAVLCFLLSASNLGLAFIRMENRAGRFSSIQIANSIINYSAFFLILIFIEKTYKAFIYASLISSIFQLIFVYFFSLRIPISDWTKCFRLPWNLKENLKFGLPFVPAFFVEYVFSNSDRYFLRLFGDFRSLGIYSLGLRLSSAFNVVQSGFHMYWTPFSYDRFLSDPDDKAFYPRIFDLLNWGLLTLILMAHSFREVITYIIAPEYHGVIKFFSFLLFAPYLYSLTEITQVGINFSLKTRLFLWINGLTLLVNVSAGYLLIQGFGQTGVALNVAITSITLFVLKSYYGIKNYDTRINWKKFSLSFLSVFLFLAVDLFGSMDWKTRLLVLILEVVFISSLYLGSIRYLWSLIFSLTSPKKNNTP